MINTVVGNVHCIRQYLIKTEANNWHARHWQMQLNLTSGFLQFLSESSYFSLKSSNTSCSIFIHHSLATINIYKGLNSSLRAIQAKLNGTNSKEHKSSQKHIPCS